MRAKLQAFIVMFIVW